MRRLSCYTGFISHQVRKSVWAVLQHMASFLKDILSIFSFSFLHVDIHFSLHHLLKTVLPPPPMHFLDSLVENWLDIALCLLLCYHFKFFFFFWFGFSSSLGYPGTYSVDQAGLGLRFICLWLPSAGLNWCVIIPSHYHATFDNMLCNKLEIRYCDVPSLKHR